MTAAIARICLPLFVPGDRPERFAKAAAAGADAVCIDLEDAVSPAAKAGARARLAQEIAAAAAGGPVLLRVNAADTPWHGEDLAAAAALPLAAIMLPKAESAAQVRAAAAGGHPVVALIESARGLDRAAEIAQAAARLAFGSIDYAADLGIGHTRFALAQARGALVLASRLAGLPPPIDGVTTAIRDAALIEDDARHAVEMGFGGKLLIHPGQIAPARAGFAPSDEETGWARRVLDAAGDGAAVAVDGAMVDAPVIARAQALLARVQDPGASA
ncbi:HpcH/HpaI aldolase/citrate lyase family protein [Frigidibacter sp. MR17.24]|uniref:HpcH/HpaI aldolase/citrate lyase family protein n=1 Tax=Frigidibacter sp. MR17.24 TaxID=3127345 RepID=UPI003012CC95